MENRWWSEVENWGNLGMGDLVPGETQARPGGALSAVRLNLNRDNKTSRWSQLPRLVLAVKRIIFNLGLKLTLLF